MMDISNNNTWIKQFGVLPIKLNPILAEERYLMLNGGYSDFCLQSFDDSDFELDKIAWSSNVKNYVKIITDNVVIRNWYENKTETVKKDKVISNFNQFYNYIFNKSYKTESDIVPFVIDIFNQLRNITQESSDPLEALNLLFILLVSIEEDYNNIDKSIWGIDNVNLPHSFDYFVERIREGVKTAKPNLDLILRHSSGRLFQEANRNVISFNPQRDLFGGISSKLITESIAYTSIHYTPQYLARAIVENCLDNLDLNALNEISILDPSCGSSEFLIEILKQLKNRNYTGNINIKGFDNSKNAIETSRFLLNYENRTQWNHSLRIDLRVVEDSLTEEWGINDVLLMNPPFTSFELIKDKEIKATVSPFAIRPGEIKVFDGKDGYVSMNQIIHKINVGHINDLHFKILELVNKFEFMTSRQIFQMLEWEHIDIESQDKLNNKLDALVKSKILTRYYFTSDEGKGIYRI